MPASVEFFYDFISPNAYLAWHVLRDLAAERELELVLRPVLFAGLLQAHGQVGPAEVAPKMQWMVRNCLRKAASLGIAIAPPNSHPFNPLLPLRVALASESGDSMRLTEALFRAVWAESRDVSDNDSINAILTESGFDATTLIAAAGSDAVKTRLRASTENAVSRGVFGVPTMIVNRQDQELFFGFDDLPWLQRFLHDDDVLEKQTYDNWLQIRPSAWRKNR